MIAIVELEKRMAGIHIFSIFIYKFCYKQKLYPVILLLIDKKPRIRFYRAILPFDLVVQLQIKCSRKFFFNAKKVV